MDVYATAAAQHRAAASLKSAPAESFSGLDRAGSKSSSQGLDTAREAVDRARRVLPEELGANVDVEA